MAKTDETADTEKTSRYGIVRIARDMTKMRGALERITETAPQEGKERTPHPLDDLLPGDGELLLIVSIQDFENPKAARDELEFCEPGDYAIIRVVEGSTVDPPEQPVRNQVTPRAL